MEKGKNVVFRSAAGGYNKRDVNAFIASLNANFAEAEEQYQREIAALKAELAEAKAALDASKVPAEEAPVDSVECGAEELAALYKKAELYDSMSSQLGDMMISANHSADRLLHDARRDAELSLATARTTIAQNASLLSTQLDELYRGANGRAVSSIRAAMHQTSHALTTFLDEMSRRRDALDETLKQVDVDTRRAAEAQIAQLLVRCEEAVAAVGAKSEREKADA